MNHLKFTALICLMAVLCFSSCSKKGPAGPQGEQGSKGEQGEQGVPGADGSTIFSGTGKPADDLGKIGDYYLDKSHSELYGPKTEDGWGTPLDLKGEQGDKGDKGEKGDEGDPGQKGKDGKDGQDGSQFLSGSSKPASSVGKVGDYYWDISTYTLYGPKTTSGWGSGIVLRGPKGDKGEKGDPGNANVISSGWMTIPADYWEYISADNPFVGLSDGGLLSLGGSVIIDFPHGYAVANKNANGALLLYVDRDVEGDFLSYGIKATPFQLVFSVPISPSTDRYYTTEFTFVAEKIQDSTYVYPLLALVSGNWGYVTSIIDLLSQVKWKIVAIPANVIARKSSPPPDPKDYKATCAYYGIPE